MLHQVDTGNNRHYTTIQIQITLPDFNAQHVVLHFMFVFNCCAVTSRCHALQNSGQQQGSQNRQGNPLEFLQLLASLTKRW